MKKILSILFALISLATFGQTYDPATAGVSVNKAMAIAQAAPTDARSMFWDNTNFVYRAYTSTNEVMSYLNLAKYRTGNFPIVINTGGTLGGNGVIVGGSNAIYWFKDGTNLSNLVPLNNIISVNGRTGAVLVKNADSLMTLPIDTSARRNNYALTYDSVNRKWYLAPAGSEQTYTPGVGIDITSGVIKALNTQALWNASQLQGRAVSSSAPAVGQIPKWNGLSYTPSQDNTGLESGYWSNDTLYLISDGDTTEIFISLSPVGDNWGTQTIAANPAFFVGAGLSSDQLDLDTITHVATKWEIQNLQNQIDNFSPGGGGGVTTRLINTILPDSLSVKINDSTYRIKALVGGANITITNQGDTALSLSSTPGTAEINTEDGTLATTGDITVGVESVVDYILVKPTSNLTAFKVGIVSDDDLFIPSTPVPATGEYIMLIAPFYLTTSTAVRFSGITSSTDIQIIFKPLHR